MDRNRKTATALVLSLAVLGTAIEAQANSREDCQRLRLHGAHHRSESDLVIRCVPDEEG
jgi:hypothetical protein